MTTAVAHYRTSLPATAELRNPRWSEQERPPVLSRFRGQEPPEPTHHITPQDATVRASNPDRIHKKLALLQRTGLFAGGPPDIAIQRARTAEEFRAAYRLVHDVYVERGYCREKDCGKRHRGFEATLKMATFIATTTDGTVVGVLSVVGDCGPCGLPSEGAFGEEIAAIRTAGFQLCEVTNQAIDSRYRKTALATELMRCAMAHGISMGYQRAIATVSPGHVGFYNILNFFPIGPARSYSQTIHDPVIALCGDLDFYRAESDGLTEPSAFIHRFMTSENPFLSRVARWHDEAHFTFHEPNFLRTLLNCECSFPEECTDSEVVFIEEQLGWQLFEEATEPDTMDGSTFWTNRIASCPADGGNKPLCVHWPDFTHLPGPA